MRSPWRRAEPRTLRRKRQPDQRRIRPRPREPAREPVEVQITPLAPAGQNDVEIRIDRQQIDEHQRHHQRGGRQCRPPARAAGAAPALWPASRSEAGETAGRRPVECEPRCDCKNVAPILMKRQRDNQQQAHAGARSRIASEASAPRRKQVEAWRSAPPSRRRITTLPSRAGHVSMSPSRRAARRAARPAWSDRACSQRARGQSPTPNSRGAGYIVAKGHSAARQTERARIALEPEHAQTPQQATVEQQRPSQARSSPRQATRRSYWRRDRDWRRRASAARSAPPPSCLTAPRQHESQRHGAPRANADTPPARPARRTACNRGRW